MRRVWVVLLLVAVGVVTALGPAAEGADSRAPGDLRWTRQFGTSGWDGGQAVAVNSSGVYVTGAVNGALPGQTHQAGFDVFVRKYDHAGKHRWTRQSGCSDWDAGRGVAVNSSGVYIAGNVGGALPRQTHQGGFDVFVRHYSRDGQHRWTRQFGTAGADAGWKVAVNASGVYVAGHAGGALPGYTHQGGYDVFVRRYDQAGKRHWTRQFGTAGADAGRGVAANNIAVYVTGYVSGALPHQTHGGAIDVFLRKYSTK
ncbi:MAG: hypothetical protein FJW79_11825 [Actinobacteria bacterium]|nr:hypothetical protein [Actinomycetota bacterium]